MLGLPRLPESDETKSVTYTRKNKDGDYSKDHSFKFAAIKAAIWEVSVYVYIFKASFTKLITYKYLI